MVVFVRVYFDGSVEWCEVGGLVALAAVAFWGHGEGCWLQGWVWYTGCVKNG